MIMFVKRVGSGLGLPLILPTTNLGYFLLSLWSLKKTFLVIIQTFFMVYKMYVFFCFNNHSSPRLGILLLVPCNHERTRLRVYWFPSWLKLQPCFLIGGNYCIRKKGVIIWLHRKSGGRERHAPLYLKWRAKCWSILEYLFSY